MTTDKKKNKRVKDHDPEKYINLEPTIREAKNSTVVISFGRFNPITVGHEKLVNKVIAEALRRKATPMIFMSHSQDKKKNPLSYKEKIEYATKAFGRVVKSSTARTIIEVAKQLSGQFDNLVVVVGQDRIQEFNKLLNTYNGKEYNFSKIEIVSAGERDPDSEGVEGMSASKMRAFAQEGNYDQFVQGLPKKLKPISKKIYDTIRAAMGLSEAVEELEERGPLSISQRRRRGRVMKRYKAKIAAARKRARRRKANPEKLKLRAQRKALGIIRGRLARNKKYGEMSDAEKIALDKRLARVPQVVIARIARRELPKVRRAEVERLARAVKSEDLNSAFENFITEAQDPDVKHMPGSQPKGYYKGVAKSVKDDRARHFAKHAKMDDDNPAAYKPAPGDEGAETKPSKHTKKFKQMFGEASCVDTKVRKRPHMALEKNGSVKIDKRFRFFKKKLEESHEDLLFDMLDLQESVEQMHESAEKALKDKAEKSGISYSILKKVYDRGVAAWRTGHRPGTTPSQWGLARVNSFATKGKGTWGKADKDLADKVRNESVSSTEVKPFVQTKDPNKAVKVSDTTKHKLGVGLSMKHMLQHGIKAVDKDNDGDVDAFEKTTPDEITGAEKKNLTKVMQKKLAGEVKHSKVGHAFESVEIFTLDEQFELRFLDEASILDKALEKIHKYVLQGTELGDIAYQVSRAAGVNKTGRELEKAYVNKYGAPSKSSVAPERISTLKKKYGFKEEVNENEAADRVRARIKAEKERDKRKHDLMLDRAKMKDLSTKLKQEGSKDPSDREWGTDSLTKTYKKDTPGENLKEESPYMKDLPRGSRVRFEVKKITGEEYNEEGTVVGTDEDTLRLRVRSDDGRLHIVKHEDAEKIGE